MKKISEQEKIEANNLLEEASSILDVCVSCGLCREICPFFKALGEETVTARGHSLLLRDKVLEKSVFQCNLCKACEVTCPVSIPVCDAIRAAREAAVLKGKGMDKDLEMVDKIKKCGSAYGEEEVPEIEEKREE